MSPCDTHPPWQTTKYKSKGERDTANGKTIPSSQPITIIVRYLEEEKTFQKGTIINATKEELESCSLNHWFCASSLSYITISSHCELLHLNLVRNNVFKNGLLKCVIQQRESIIKWCSDP